MRLYLIRHAPAVERRPGVPDRKRPLTPRGRARFIRAAAGLASLGCRFDLLLHSPRCRAAQTAELCARLVHGRTAASPDLERAPDDPLLAALRGGHVALVGHEPWLSALAAWLVAGNRDRGSRFVLKKGGVLILDGEPKPGAMRLVASMPPKVLRRLGRR